MIKWLCREGLIAKGKCLIYRTRPIWIAIRDFGNAAPSPKTFLRVSYSQLFKRCLHRSASITKRGFELNEPLMHLQLCDCDPTQNDWLKNGHETLWLKSKR